MAGENLNALDQSDPDVVLELIVPAQYKYRWIAEIQRLQERTGALNMTTAMLFAVEFQNRALDLLDQGYSEIGLKRRRRKSIWDPFRR